MLLFVKLFRIQVCLSVGRDDLQSKKKDNIRTSHHLSFQESAMAPLPTVTKVLDPHDKQSMCSPKEVGKWTSKLGCFILCSDVPKVKNFICSHPDPLIWFTRFPK